MWCNILVTEQSIENTCIWHFIDATSMYDSRGKQTKVEDSPCYTALAKTLHSPRLCQGLKGDYS